MMGTVSPRPRHRYVVMRTRTLLLGLAALSSAAGCAARAGSVAPPPDAISWDPPPGAPAHVSARAAAPPATMPASAPAQASAVIGSATPARGPLRVYVIDGADPLGFANTRGLADRLRGAGHDTHYAGWLRTGKVEREIRAAHAADPSARFAVVGYSAGVYTARNLVNRLTRDGVPVAVVGYVGGDYLSDSPATRAGGAGRVVNVTGNGHPLTGRNLFFNGTDIAGARNMRLAGTGHFGLPGHPDTFAALEAELAAAAGE